MKKKIGFFALTLMTSQAWAQAKNPKDLRERAEEKTEYKIAADIKNSEPFAKATLVPKSASKMTGSVLFTRTSAGIHVIASVKNGPTGRHGFHIHEKGDCSAPDASSAGGHFNPTGAPHAGPNASMRHAGDLGNITINNDGIGHLTLDIPDVSGFTDWNQIVGKAVVVHAKVDDEKSQPSGDAGDRIACGVIEATRKQEKK